MTNVGATMKYRKCIPGTHRFRETHVGGGRHALVCIECGAKIKEQS